MTVDNLKLVIERDVIQMIRMMRTMKKKKEEEKNKGKNMAFDLKVS